MAKINLIIKTLRLEGDSRRGEARLCFRESQ